MSQQDQTMKVTLDEKAGTITVTVPIDKDHPLTKSKKNRMLYSTYGTLPTGQMMKGKPVMISMNMYYKAEPQPE